MQVDNNSTCIYSQVRRPLSSEVSAMLEGLVRLLIEQAGAMLAFLPPYSYDFNPIESAWALIKKRIRAIGPRTGRAPDLRY